MDATVNDAQKSWSTTRQAPTLRLLLIEKERAELLEEKRRIEIGQRMKDRRDELLLTQEHVAREINTSTRQYQRWEGGQGTDRENYAAIAAVLNVSLEWLLHGEEVPGVATGDLVTDLRETIDGLREEMLLLRADVVELGVDFARDKAQAQKWRRRARGSGK